MNNDPFLHKKPLSIAAITFVAAAALGGCGRTIECDPSNTRTVVIEPGATYWSYANQVGGDNVDSDVRSQLITVIEDMNHGKKLQAGLRAKLPAKGSCDF